MNSEAWPALPLDQWRDTYATLHMWLQIVGKIRLRHSVPVNHFWHSALYVTAWGLTTSPLQHGDRTFEIDLDFVNHRLEVRTSDGRSRGVMLRAEPVATFYARVIETLNALGLPAKIHGTPNEVADAIPFARDQQHHMYDRDHAHRFWRVLLESDRVMKVFRAGFIGKCSPVHLFWGGPDLAVTRFSGRQAPTHPGGIPNLPDWITRESYSHEVSSCGFWPGGGPIPYPAYYAYAYPQPDGFADAAVAAGAFYSRDLREFVLPYDKVRESSSPDDMLLEFFQMTYDAAANLGSWDRAALEKTVPGRT